MFLIYKEIRFSLSDTLVLYRDYQDHLQSTTYMRRLSTKLVHLRIWRRNNIEFQLLLSQ